MSSQTLHEFPLDRAAVMEVLPHRDPALIVGLKGGIEEGSFIGFTGVEQAKFRRAVKPGDVLDIHVDLLKERRGFCKFEGRILVAGEVVTELKFAATQMSL